jgi:hypothetical protein
LRDIHEAQNHNGNDASLEYSLLQTGMYFKHSQKKLATFANKKTGRAVHILSQSQAGPTEELASLFTATFANAQWQVD